MKTFIFLLVTLFSGCSWAGLAAIESFPIGKAAPAQAKGLNVAIMQSEHSPFALTVADAGFPPIRLAHAILVKSQPEKDAVISDVPDDVLLIFNDRVGEEYLALAVIDETGARVDQHDAKLDFSDHSHLRASVSKLSPGRYFVRYRVLSADGHVVSGKYSFQVAPNPH